MKKYYASLFCMLWMLCVPLFATDVPAGEEDLLETEGFKEALSGYDVAVHGGSVSPCMEHLQDALVAFNALGGENHIRVCFYQERLYRVAAEKCLAMPEIGRLALLQYQYYMVMMKTVGERGRRRFWAKWGEVLAALGYESVAVFEARVPQSRALPSDPEEAAAVQAEYDRVFADRREMKYDWICAYYYPSESDGEDSDESLYSLSDASSAGGAAGGSVGSDDDERVATP